MKKFSGQKFISTSLLCLLCLSLVATPASAGWYRPGRVVDHLPLGHKVLRHGLFIHDGIYYRQKGDHFLIVAPPVGLVVGRLPVGYVSLTIAGMTYFYYQDVYYRPVENGYLVVEKPTDLATQKTDVEMAEPGDTVAVFADWLNLRSGPAKTHPVQKVLRKGTELKVKEVNGNWYFVELEEGFSGWVMIRYTRKLMSAAQG